MFSDINIFAGYWKSQIFLINSVNSPDWRKHTTASRSSSLLISSLESCTISLRKLRWTAPPFSVSLFALLSIIFCKVMKLLGKLWYCARITVHVTRHGQVNNFLANSSTFEFLLALTNTMLRITRVSEGLRSSWIRFVIFSKWDFLRPADRLSICVPTTITFAAGHWSRMFASHGFSASTLSTLALASNTRIWMSFSFRKQRCTHALASLPENSHMRKTRETFLRAQQRHSPFTSLMIHFWTWRISFAFFDFNFWPSRTLACLDCFKTLLDASKRSKVVLPPDRGPQTTTLRCGFGADFLRPPWRWPTKSRVLPRRSEAFMSSFTSVCKNSPTWQDFPFHLVE